MTKEWKLIKDLKNEKAKCVLGYWCYYDQINRLTEGWEILERTEFGWEDWEGNIDYDGSYTHYKLLDSPNTIIDLHHD